MSCVWSVFSCTIVSVIVVCFYDVDRSRVVEWAHTSPLFMLSVSSRCLQCVSTAGGVGGRGGAGRVKVV